MIFTNLIVAILLLPAMLLVASSSSTVTREKKVVTIERDMELRRLSDEGLRFIKEKEGVVDKIYNDGTGILTGGVGHRLKTEERMKWKAGFYVSDCQMDEWLRNDVAEAEKCVNNWVIPDIGQAAFDALVSLVFNIGCGNFKRSTLLKKLNKSLMDEAAQEFSRWTYSGGKRLAGLVARRAEEARIFRDSEWDIASL